MSSPPSIIQDLRKRGHRITKVRDAVIQLLEGSDIPLAAADLMAGLKRKRLAVNKTTVYREIEFLLQQRIIREIDLLEGKKRYELIGEKGHHHHIVCLKCKGIRCVDMDRDLDLLERHILKHHRFKVVHHTLEFFGLCEKCQN